MILLVISSIFSMILITIQTKNYTTFKMAVKQIEKDNNSHMEHTSVPFLFYLVRIVTILVTIGFIAYVGVGMDSIENGFLFWTMAVGLILFSIMLTDLLFGRYHHSIYYDDKGFIVDNTYVRFSNVKQASDDGKDIYLKNGKMIHSDKKRVKQLLQLKEKLDA